MIDMSSLFVPQSFDLDSCSFLISNDCYLAMQNNSLKVSVNKIGRAKEKLHNIKITLKNTSGRLDFNFSSGFSSVFIDENVHGKFDFRLYRNSDVKIGKGTTSGSTAVFCKDSALSIGEDCMFSTGVTIQASDQHGIVDIEQGRIVNSGHKELRIGDHVWLARFVTLTSNVHIGNGSIVGIGSVVTSEIPENVISAGVPARVIKENHTWCRSPDFFDDYSLKVINKEI